MSAPPVPKLFDPEGLELARRHAALMYRKRRRALLRGRALGLPVEMLNVVKVQVINWRAAWLAARSLSQE